MMFYYAQPSVNRQAVISHKFKVEKRFIKCDDLYHEIFSASFLSHSDLFLC